MTIVQGNSDNVEKLKDDLENLKIDVQRKFDDKQCTNDDIQTFMENTVELKEKVPDEDMTFLVHELKSCIQSNRRIEEDNSAIKEKLYKVYGKNFLNR